jgi:hypothetical protein
MKRLAIGSPIRFGISSGSLDAYRHANSPIENPVIEPW